MKTITFYSYKGGVGRSLVLANLAQRLVEFGKSVCMLDFDLEAPGLPFKFDAEKILAMDKKGIVDFVTNYQNTRKPPQTLDGEYYIRLNEGKENQRPLHLIIAGNTDKQEYWKNLAAIDWKEMFYTEQGRGYRLMLHLKALIEKELKPDYLLIDSRTGVTETSGVTLSILADEIVVVAANNQENIYGSKMIMKGISRTIRADKTPPIHFVLSRVPFSKEPEERLKEKDRIDGLLKNFMKAEIRLHDPIIHLLHSERKLEEKEMLMINEFKREAQVHIGEDYRKLFKNLFTRDFSDDEKVRFEKQEKAFELYADFLKEEDDIKRLQLINESIELYPRANFYIQRASITESIPEKEKETIEDYKRALELEPTNMITYINFGFYLKRIRKYDEGLEILTPAISRIGGSALYFVRSLFYKDLGEKDKQESDLLNAVAHSETAFFSDTLAEFYFEEKKYKESYEFAYKALESKSNKAHIFYLIAKLQLAYKKNEEEFFLNLDHSLSIEHTAEAIKRKLANDDFFKPVLSDERFQRILYKYNIKMKLPEKPEDGTSNERK